MSGVTIGVDVGGTFTDFVLHDPASNALHFEKLLTTPEDPSVAVLDGVARIMASAGVTPATVARVVHGTTLVANALIERKGARVALVTTEGFQDVIEIGRENRYDTYDLSITMPEPLIARPLRFEVAERIGHDGSVLQAFDRDSALSAARGIASSGAEAVAVVFLHAFTNPAHEQAMAELLQQILPGRTVCTSSDVVPVIGEYERSTTTIANAYVQPVFDRYLRRLSEGLARLGITRELQLMLSDGGTVEASAAIAAPIRLVHSGPAGGAEAAALFGGIAGLEQVVCFDMGGTTAKACLIEGGRPSRTTEVEIARLARFKPGSGIPLRVPIVSMIEIGAGGGSIARVNSMGLIQVGPESASSRPGPVCYGQGGREPTVTDADLVLGYLDAGNFLGGAMRLDLEAARAAILRDLGVPLNLPMEAAAWGILETVNANMAQAMVIQALEQGKRLSDFALLPIGGAGPVHACIVARRADIAKVVCPLGPGVASALGFLSAPTSFELLRTAVAPLHGADYGALLSMLDALRDEGRALLARAGVKDGVTTQITCGLRYAGQGYDVEAQIAREEIASADAAAIAARFERNYAALFGRTEAGISIEMVSWRVVTSGPRAGLRPDVPVHARGDTAVFQKGQRDVWFAETRGFRRTPVFNRYAARPGTRLAGPAVFEERESTFVVPPDARVEVDEGLNLTVSL
ncbi:hydantoinase/oxoprolinase family protein [Falsiroseomonas sp. HW251]|uniref:hydantoinase/oxoprolinase family protein n=1 Tax=Falsiroseomonas sp. HW251 TaxID=3390998 RepID=UPI003D3152B1